MIKEKEDIMRTVSYALRPSTSERLKRQKETNNDKTWDIFFNELLDMLERHKKQKEGD